MTTFKELSVAEFKSIKDVDAFRSIRDTLRRYGVDKLQSELEAKGLVERGYLTTGTKPFNFFAILGVGEMTQADMEDANERMFHKKYFVLACNRPENDAHCDSDDPAWVGKASMSKHHRFLTTKDLYWMWFNVLTFGIGGTVEELEDALKMLMRMREASMEYVFSSDEDWSMNIGLFFHVYGHNSVDSLHLHIVDLDATGPTYEVMKYKNLSLEDVETVLYEELVEARAKEAVYFYYKWSIVVAIMAFGVYHFFR